MKISYKWLLEYLPVSPEPEALSEILTAIGLEVENLEKFEEIPGSLEGLLVGEVLEVTAHPGADKLRLTRVSIADGEPLKIVCGAPNVAAGQKVVVAPVGATLHPLGGEPFTIRSARIRGEASLGMLCAADEIGLGEDHQGILVLDPAAVPGTPAKDYFRPGEDWVYEIGLTPNRMDAMSHLGVARDVCAWLSIREGERTTPRLHPVDAFRVRDETLPVSVTIENPVACPRYAGVALTEVKISESPGWLKRKLKALGVRPINNVVDITNFVLHETGQPLHAFDADKIHDHRIIVRNLAANTPFVTLDGKERKLDAEDLMITDPQGGLCIAGVFGGASSGITEATTRVFLESACFQATAVRRTSFRHDLRTDAALRFEKGVDISGVIYALKRAALLMEELAGARVSSAVVDEYPDPRPRVEVPFRYDYLTRLSGKQYEKSHVTAILSSLGFELSGQNAEGFVAAVPFSKPDIALPADLAEEVMRIDGYDNIRIPTHIRISPALAATGDAESVRERVSRYLTGSGFFEIFTNSITFSGYYPASQPLIRLMNSLTTELDVMRPSLVETGLEAVAYNLNRRQEDILFFEVGKTYLPDGDGYREKRHLALYLSGRKSPESWQHVSGPVDMYFLKGHLENVFRVLGLQTPDFTAEETPGGRLEAALSIRTAGAKTVGALGAVDSATLRQFRIKHPVYYAELDWDWLVKSASRVKTTYREIPRYPSMRRDLALILDKHIPFTKVRETIYSVKSGILERLNLFDVFESEKLGRDKKSLALSFTFLDQEKTLTDKEIDKVMQKFIRALETGLQAEIRKG
jgi:phenylalanyl-tRNA synthetase beta chain